VADEVVIVGLGSVLAGDDGVGVRVAELLEASELPDGCSVVEGGLLGMDLVFALEGASGAVIVDAARMGEQPGTVRAFSPEDIAGLPDMHMGVAHSVGLTEALTMLELLGSRPTVRIIGIEPESLTLGDDLSEPVRPAVPRAAALALAEARALLGCV
jgi:hydrogenase maturation protease